MFSKVTLSLFFLLLVTCTQAQTDSLMKDSLYLKAIQMTNELNASKTNFAEKEKAPGFMVSNAAKNSTIQSGYSNTNANAANPHHASDPVSAVILGAYNSLFTAKKK